MRRHRENEAGRAAAVLRGLCPRCRGGRIFRGLLAMHGSCPRCGLDFLREPGYFTGAMYFSYFMAVPVIGLAAWAIHLLRPDLSFAAVAGLSALACLPFAPLLFRYARILWIHFDRWID